jgi:cytochrome c oxidase assembly protein subunit 15
MWCAWFATHLPWWGIQEQIATPVVVFVWWASMVWLVGRLPKSQAFLTGLLGGIISAVLGLLILGSRLVAPPDSANATAGLIPSAPLLALGFLGLGAAIGAVAGVVGRLMASDRAPILTREHWLERFAIITVIAIAPLLFIGGLVTSTNSGMAVPDWPRTWGANMFLYPLGSHTPPGIFLEHAHRLFGSLIGITTAVLMFSVIAIEKRRWVILLAVVAFALVCIQGVLGGQRVHLQTYFHPQDAAGAELLGRRLAMFHGVLAQLTFGLVAALAVTLSPLFREIGRSGIQIDPVIAKRFKTFATAATHALILQLIMGAWYRHLGTRHALFAHMGFSVFVVITSLLAAFTLNSPGMKASTLGPRCGRIGTALVVVVALQFAFGWVVFIFGNVGETAQSVTQALLRTAHQANGAVLIALVASAYTWALRVKSAARAS